MYLNLLYMKIYIDHSFGEIIIKGMDTGTMCYGDYPH